MPTRHEDGPFCGPTSMYIAAAVALSYLAEIFEAEQETPERAA
jgi:hypothetical protein